MAKAPTDIRSLARNHTEEAINRLAYWMRSDNAKASVSACLGLMDRGWGKAEVKAEIVHIKYVADVPAVSETVEQWHQQHNPTLQ